MSAAERRAQRRKKVLENSESRLQRILGSRSSHPDNSKSNLVVDGNISNSSSVGNADNSCKNILSVDTKESDYTTGEIKKLPVEKNQGDQISDMYPAEGNTCGSQDSEANENSFLDNEVKRLPKVTSTRSRSHNTFPSTAAVNETHSDESSGFSTAIWTRTVFVVILAFSLVIRWTYVNLEVLFSINVENSRNDVSNDAVLVQSESMIWPFLALQLLFVCVPSFRQTSNSAYISLLTVALQLCGIPIEFTQRINFLFTALLVAIKDFGVFFFSVVVVHCLVEYSISVGLLKYVMET
ncbi:guided entry of tail-anchored proteins factor CAMLG [Pocillopora verrucosa]|uniref:guided entry of tail-anchored proteins factor CAMLG n=1 Tax=Pocillopora verrucosa TaxID=203993 RepID=UPI003340856C